MILEREFKKGSSSITIAMTLQKGRLETVVKAGGKEKREAREASSFVFEGYVKLVQKQLRAGLVAVPLKNAAEVADQLLAVRDLELDLAGVLDAFPPEEHAAIVAKQIAKAEAKGKVVGPDAGYSRANILVKCPTQPLLRHFLSRMLDGSLKYTYSGGGLNGDLQFFATAISNAARDPANRQWIVDEVNRVLPDAEPVLKAWLKARIAKFNEQAKTKKALEAAPAKPGQLEEGLLAEIGKSPADDGPRLVWADWLQERQHPWGEVVALQCESARLDAERTTAGDARRAEIDARTDELSARLGKIQGRASTKFLEPIRAFIKEWSFERGLISRLGASMEKLLMPGAAEAVILRAPGARLELTGLKKPQAAKLATLPRGRFAELKLPAQPPADVLEKLVQSPLVAGVEAFELWGVDDGIVLALTSMDPAVKSLVLWHSAAGVSSIAALTKARAAKSLEELLFPFAEQPLSRAAVEAISGLPSLKAVTVPLADAGCGALLARCSKLEKLQVVANAHWDDADCLALAKSTAALRELDLRGTAATAKGISALLRFGAASLRLEYRGSGLDFGAAKPSEAATFVCPDFDDADAVALAASPFGQKLAYLEIESAAVGDRGAEALMRLPAIGTSLYLKGAKLSAKCAAKLKKLQGE